MAEQRQTSTEQDIDRYQSNGSAALQPERQPKEPQKHELEKGKLDSQIDKAKREKLDGLRVRKPERVALFAIIGFAVVVFMTAVCLCMNVQLYHIYEEIEDNNNTLAQLQKEEESLVGQYDQTFDMGSIETQMMAGGKMNKPTGSQSVYLELSEPDRTEVYQGVQGVLDTIWDKLEEIVEYFQ